MGEVEVIQPAPVGVEVVGGGKALGLLRVAKA